MTPLQTLITNFHFLRPLWLLAVLPGAGLFYALWRRHGQGGQWQKVIDAALLPFLMGRDLADNRSHRPLTALLAAWLLASVSLAGPTWEKLPQPVHKKQDALVLIQDLSLSLYAQDLAPDRLTRARHKLMDILAARTEGTTALIVYAGDAHVVCPLTDDTRTIAAMLPALSPELMPRYGSNIEEAVELALQLLHNTAASRGGRLLLLSDEVTAEDVEAVSRRIQGTGATLSVMGIGTEEGGPIPKGDGGFLKDEQGNIVVPRLSRALFQELARRNNGRYSDIQLTDRDLDALLAPALALPAARGYRPVDRRADQWRDQGPWLVLLILPLALLAFRRGWLLGLTLALCLWSGESHAMGWQDLWQRSDQRAAAALARNDPQQAAKLFRTPEWKGVAEYRAGNYGQAAADFAATPTATAHYNRGNALAKAGRLEEAMGAYDQALRLAPNLADAKFNRQLVEKALRQQRQQEQKEPRQQQKGEKGDQGNDLQEDKDEAKKKTADRQAATDANRPARKESNAPTRKGQQPREQPRAQAREQPTPKPPQGTETRAGTGSAPALANGPPPAPGKAGKQQDGTASETAGAIATEQQQALEQWLRQIPDDPGGLLRRKFEYESAQNQRRQRPQNSKIW